VPIFTTYNLGSTDVWQSGSEPQRSPLNLALHCSLVPKPASCSRLWLCTIRPPETLLTVGLTIIICPIAIA